MFGEMFGTSGIEGGLDSVICNGHRSISGPRHGLINMFINHTVSDGVSSGLAARHSIYAVHLLPATTQLNVEPGEQTST